MKLFRKVPRYNLFPIIALLFLLLAIPATVVLTLQSPDPDSDAANTNGVFTETFDGNPAAPEPFTQLNQNTWDVQVHSRNNDTWYQLENIHAMHGHDCSAPPASHENRSYENAVFKCRNHLMTAINSSGYGVIYLTPNQIFNFAGGGSITFELSTERMSTRDWWDMYITPFDSNRALPLLSDLSQGVDLQGYPSELIHIGADNGEGAPDLKVVRNGQVTDYTSFTPSLNTGIDSSVNQMATRQTFKFTVANGRMKFERLESSTAGALVYWDVAATAGFTSGVVQFGHHSYTPEKDNAGVPATWHWDSFVISPATDFKMIKGDKRYVDTNDAVVTFNEPAPDNAMLRFAGIGRISVSYNGGPYQVVPPQPSSDSRHPEHHSSFFTAVPAGTKTVAFRFSKDDWYEHGYIAKDFAIWSQSSGSGGTPPTVTTTPTTTSTPTLSPTPTPTRTPTPTITPTPTPTTTVSSLNRINYLGKNWYLHGANVPWYNWACDFGCNSNGGVSTNKTVLSAGFQKLKDAGMNNARWWVFPGNPWQINRGSNGAPSGLNPAIYADFDAALQLAEQYDLYYNFVLFSSLTDIPASWINDSTQRSQLASVLGPLFAKYRNNPRVMSWEIFNEPEFQIWNNGISQTNVQALVRAITNSVHVNSDSLVTVGGAMLDGLPMWVGLGLDYYSPHWYDYMNSGDWCALCTNYVTIKTKYNLDKPVVIGELYVGSDTNPLTRLNDFYTKGYAGAWPWSLFSERTNDKLTIDWTAAKSFSGTKTDLGPRLGSGGVTPTLTPTLTLTPTPTPLPTPVGSTIVVHAAGTQAGNVFPSMALVIGDGVVKSFTNVQGNPENRTFQTFSYTHPSKVAAKDVKVRFTNDLADSSGDRNLTVDKVTVDGIDYQTEAKDTFSDGSWAASDGCAPGFKGSETLHCVGYFAYNQPLPTPTINPSPTPLPTSTPIPTPTITPGLGDGLNGNYYNNANLTGFVLSRTDRTIDFNWGSGSPDTKMGRDTYSVRWTGQVLAPNSEEYTFYTRSDDGVRLWVNDQLIINQWNDHAAREHSAKIRLEAGKKYNIKIEYYENRGQSVMQLRWGTPTLAKQIIPQRYLFTQ